MTQSQPTKSYYRTESYGKNPIIISYINCWNKTQKMLGLSLLNLFIEPKLKTCLQSDASTNSKNLLKYYRKIVLG